MSNTLGTKRLGTVLALIVAFAIALAMIVTPAAHAQGLDAPGVGDQDEAEDTASQAQNLNIGNIKADKTDASITVHKYTAPSTGEGKGTSSSVTGLDDSRKLNGVQFTLYPINGINLKKAADWDKLKDLKYVGDATTGKFQVKGVDTNDYTKGTAQVKKTAGEGVAVFTSLPVGAYLVIETDKSEAKNKAGEAVNVVKEVAPFIVTVPYPLTKESTDDEFGEAEDGWLYNVHVYPKNEVTDRIEKELDVNDPAHVVTTVGSDLKWKITVPVPAIEPAIRTFEINDTLKNGTVVSDANQAVVTLDGTTLTAGTDNNAATDYKVTGAGTANFKIEFTNAGLNKLNQNKGKKIEVTLFATVKVALGADNKVVNDELNSKYTVSTKPYDPTNPYNPTEPPGTDDPNYPNPNDPNPPTTVPFKPLDPQNPPTAFFGDYKLLKISSVTEANNKPLAGAHFAVYAENPTVNTGAQPIIADVESDSNGVVDIQDLFISKDLTKTPSKTYYVKETAAPAGFKLSEEVKEIVVTRETGKADTNGTFKNEPHGPGDLPELPLTGASGKLLMTLGGAAIVLFAAGTVLVTRRRKA